MMVPSFAPGREIPQGIQGLEPTTQARFPNAWTHPVITPGPGLGAHPGDTYYDVNRPSWLPYWIDTPTESALYYKMYPGVTQQQLNSPGSVYTPPPAPPVVRSTNPDGSPIAPVPVDGADAQRTVNGIIDQQYEDWKAVNSRFYAQLDEQVNPDTEPNPNSGGIPWYWLALGGSALLFYMTSRK